MESFGSILKGDWSSLNAMYSTEESDFMAQLINYSSITSDDIYNSVDHFSLGNYTSFYPTSGPDSYYAGNFDKILVTNDDIVFCDEEITKEENPSLVQIFSNADINGSIYMQLRQEDQLPNLESHKEVVLANSVQKSKKRSTNSGDKNQRNVKAKKNQKLTMTGCMKNKERNGTAQKQSLSSCSSENEYNEPTAVPSDSLDSKEAIMVNSIAESRAVRGSATDSQSLYARKRRERINERLRTLQNLVPNGTKVDISTMLEDAVQYVKFLQLQIKLLSSDDKWMYAPIAYNGIDLGLDSNISPQLYR